MKSLIIQFPHDPYTASLLCNPAPSLQHLEIHAWNKSIVCLPDNFLGQQASSLRFVSFSGILPTFETFFPLPNLTEFHLSLREGTGSFPMSALFRFFSDSPLLQKIIISARSRPAQDISLDQVISLESLLELELAWDLDNRILPFLKLPRLKKLRVSSLGQGNIPKLVDILPYGGSVLLAGTTHMLYHSDTFTQSLGVDLSGNGVDVSFSAFCTAAGPTVVDWFSDQTCIPFGQIEDLRVEGSPIIIPFPISAFALENLRVLRVSLWDAQFTEGFLRSLHPDPVVGVPCRPLRKIECIYWGFQEPLPRSLISLARERKRAGYQLGLVYLSAVQVSCQDLVEELREYVEEVEVGEWEAGT
jgi:hypothetical protein